MLPELPELAGVRHTYVEVNGFRAHIAEAGDPDGEPLVLQHGWPQSWWCWHKVIPRLSERYRVICPDLRGHGWSDAPENGYDKPQLASDLVGVMDALGLDRVKLIGHDWGGMAGFLACIAHPERFDRYLALAIAHPFPSGDPKALLGLWRLYYQLPLTAPVVAVRLLRNPGFVKFILNKGAYRDHTFTERDLDLYARVVNERPHATLGLYRTFITGEVAALARGRWAGPLTVPTRLVTGEHDAVVSAERMTGGYDRYATDMQIHELPGAGHFLPEEAPDAVVERALAFFA